MDLKDDKHILKSGNETVYIFPKKEYYDIIQDNLKNIYEIAILIQIGNWKVFQKMESYLNNFDNNNNHNIYFVISEYAIDKDIQYLKNKYNNSVILICKNKGMDIGLFLLNLHYIKTKKYNHKYIFKIHTKTDDEFRNNALSRIMGSNVQIMNNLKSLDDPNIGMISGHTVYKYNDYKGAFTSNMYRLEILINILYDSLEYDKLEFCAGTIFICKSYIFNILDISMIEYIYDQTNDFNSFDYYWYSVYYNLNIGDKNAINSHYNKDRYNKYSNNINYNIQTGKTGLRDCMIVHAIERLFGYMCKKCNMNII